MLPFLFLLGAVRIWLLLGLGSPDPPLPSVQTESRQMAQDTFSCPFRAIHLGTAKGKAFRFAFPFGNPIPTGQGGGCGPLTWIHPRGAKRSCQRRLYCTSILHDGAATVGIFCKLDYFRACAARTCGLFLLVQKETKDTLRGRGISIFPFP